MIEKVNKRVVSLDVFRGITVAAMIFVLILPHSETTPYILQHAAWEGIYIADLVFPFFLFIVGVSMAYAFASRSNLSKPRMWGMFLLRIAVLFGLGLFINWLAADFPLRIPGVLQLIAISSLFAAPLAKIKPKWILITASVLIIIHSAILLGIGAPGIPPGTFEQESNIAGWLDVQILGSDQLADDNFDPEGILAVISSTALVLLGLAYGRMLQIDGGNRRTLLIFYSASIICLLIGVIASWKIPLIKQLWTSSFILIIAGLAILIMTTLYAYLDIKSRRSILLAAIPLGRNALFIYVFAAILTAIIQRNIFIDTLEGNINFYTFLINYNMAIFGPTIGTIVFGLIFIFFWLILASILHYNKIYIKL